MAVKSTFSERLAGRNRRDTEKPKKKLRSIISLPRLLCSKRSTNPRPPPTKSRFRCLHIDPSSSSGSSSPEKSSPVQMPDSSPHFMKATACYDAKKGSSQGGNEWNDAVSVDSTKSDSKIKYLKGIRKSIKNFGSKRSFRRRIMKPTARQSLSFVETSDSSSNYTKAESLKSFTTPHGSESGFDSSDQSRSPIHSQSSNLTSSASLKSFQTSMRSSSLRAVRVSFKSRKRVDKATCSSTIKNSKFPEKVELLPGQAESERLSVYKVCPYHHCSLNGHSHDSSSTPPKRFHKRRVSKPEKIIKTRSESKGTKGLISIDGKLGVETSRMSAAVDRSMHKESSPKPTISVTEDSSERENTQPYADLVELVFGETSFPERNYQETLNQIGKTGDWCCSCNSVKASVDSKELRENQGEVYGKPETDEGPTVKPTPAGKFKFKNRPQVIDSEAKSSSLKALPPKANKEKHLSMWNLIHKHMVSGLAAGSEKKPDEGSDEENHADDSNKLPSPESSRMREDSCDAEVAATYVDGEIEVQKLFAIKLVREAIEKILLPEVSDHSSDDQSITCETTPDQEILENNIDNASAKEHYMDADNNKAVANALSESSFTTDSNGCQEKVKTKGEVAMKSEKKAPKHWSNLKKWILLQRFIKELEKVKKINPRKPRQLPLEHNPEAEKVHLRPQTVDEKKRTEEWMLDYALRQAINQLAPNQKRKVELLVRAFETVVPPQGGNDVQVKLPKFKSDSEEHLQMTVKENEFSSEVNETLHQSKEVDSKCVVNECSKAVDNEIKPFVSMPFESDGITSVDNDAQKEVLEDVHPLTGGSEERCETEKLDASSDITPSLTHQFDGESPTGPGKQNKKVADAENVDLQGLHKGTDLNSYSATPTSASTQRTKSMEPEAQDSNYFATPSIEIDGGENPEAIKNILEEPERKSEHQPGNPLTESMSDCKGSDGADTKHLEKRKYISMWHMISQHVLSGVVSKVGIELLDGTDDEVEDANTVGENITHHSCPDLSKPRDEADAACENLDSSHQRRNFSRDDAIKLVREAVNEILVTQVQDDSTDTQSVTSGTPPEQELPAMNQIGDEDHNESTLSEESLTECNRSEARVILGQEGNATADVGITKEHETKEVSLAKTKPALSKSRNWSKLKKLLLLKRSITALENARKLKFPPRQDLPKTPNPEPEKVDLRHQMVDERKKAEQWMLDYAVQNIVTKLTPARKRRVAMLVEAFEAVVPLPEV